MAPTRIAIRPIGYLGLTWDHRAFDGSTAVLFLRRIKHEPRDLGLGAGTVVTAPMRGPLRTRWLGRLAYDEAWDLQRAFWEGRRDGRTADDYLLLLEHPHVYTVGRNGDGSNLLVEPDAARARSAPGAPRRPGR